MLSSLIFLFASSPSLAAEPRADFLCPFRPVAFRAALSESMRPNARDITDAFTEYRERFGACRKMSRAADGSYRLRFGEASVPVKIEWAKNGRLNAIAFGAEEFPGDTREKLRERVGAGALSVLKEGKPVFSVAGESFRSVGETAQLLALRAYRRQVARGKLSPATVVTLKAADHVFSPGPLAFFPRRDVPLTLESVAQLAFRSRDNVAADLLLRAVAGAEALGLRAPVFTYRELNQLLRLPAAEGEAAWAAGKVGEASAGSLREPLLDLSPLAKKVGWFASTDELAQAAHELRDDDALTDPVAPPGWERTGEFPLTLNFTRATQVNGAWFTVSVSVSEPGQQGFARARELADRAVALAAKEP